MPFVHPLIFWLGLGAASVPIIIHLLNRRRFRTRPWAAMQFLLDSLRKNRRRLKMEELILLALRCLVIGMLALAVGRFTGCSAMEKLPFGGTESETTVFILDDSNSMGQSAGAGSLFASATADLGEQLRAQPASTKVAILSTSDARAPANPPEPKVVTDVRSVMSHFGNRRLSDTRAEYVAALKAAKAIFADAPGPKRLYIQGDFRRRDLADPDRADELRRLFAELRKLEVKIVAADYGIEAKNNITIEQVALGKGNSGYEGLVVAGVPFRVRVTVRNNSPIEARDVEVKLLPERNQEFFAIAAAEPMGSIALGSSKSCEFSVTCNRPGAAVLKAELPKDELFGDNVAYLALDVRRAVRALVVDDRRADREAAESYFLRAALQPGGQETYGCRVELVTSRELDDSALDDCDLVVLLNVANFPETTGADGRIYCRQVEDLERYVRSGGGLAIFTGGRIENEKTFYNRYLYADGAGLCPYKIDRQEGSEKEREKYFRMKLADDPDARSARGDLMRFMRIGETDVIGLVRVYAFTRAAVPESPATSAARQRPEKLPIVLARFSDPDGSPAIVYRPFGTGKVLMYYTAADNRWTNWPIAMESNLFVTAMNDMVRFLAKPQEAGLNGLAGEPFDLKVPRSLRGADARLEGLGEQVAEGGQHWEQIGEHLRYESPLRAQGYAISFKRLGRDAGAVFFARSGDPGEGELTPGGRAALDAAIAGQYEYVRRQADGQGQVLYGKPAKEYWTWALLAMLVFLAMETYLAQKFGHYT
ncbi:MAG TPA: BatA domain-containing protein [Phycisphaerae bacterium]|nr:BatA domain-containing protein [Phycisphaerae bacterium]